MFASITGIRRTRAEARARARAESISDAARRQRVVERAAEMERAWPGLDERWWMEAVEVLRPLVAAGDPGAQFHLGIALYYSGDLVGAHDELQSLVAQRPDDALAALYLGEVRRALDRDIEDFRGRPSASARRRTARSRAFQDLRARFTH